MQTLCGDPLRERKISSHLPGLQVILQPAPKLLPELRGLFPNAKIVGWKYELEGNRDTALEKGRQQLSENHSALCVVNGAAFGTGFGILNPAGACENVLARDELCQVLCLWAGGLPSL